MKRGEPLKRSPMKRGKGMSRGEGIPRSRNRISPVSKRRQKVNREYAKARADYLAAHPTCQARFDGCTGRSTDIHHVLSRGRSGRDADLVDRANFLAVCRHDHDWIESHRLEAVELGLLRHARTEALGN